MMEYLRFATQSWMHFFVCFIGMLIVGSIISTLITSTWKALTIIIKGWPPSHLDASGNFKRRDKEKES